MAKDGTRRGGNRAGAGRKSAKTPPPIMALDADLGGTSNKGRGKSQTNGGSGERTAADSSSVRSSRAKSGAAKSKSGGKSKNGGSSGGVAEMKIADELPNLEGVDVPLVDEYLRQEQRCGKPLKADLILNQTVNWLREIKCEHIVSRQLVEQYAMSVARWIQTEEMISQTGFLAKHPTTGAAIASPYVKMSQDYMKQVNQTWYQIYQLVRENVGGSIADNSDDPMERLLRMRGG